MLKLKKIINNYKKNKNNVGSIKFQILLLSLRINNLKKHISIFKKDFHNRLGLLKLIFRRRKLLKYIKLNNLCEYNFIIKILKLRY